MWAMHGDFLGPGRRVGDGGCCGTHVYAILTVWLCVRVCVCALFVCRYADGSEDRYGGGCRASTAACCGVHVARCFAADGWRSGTWYSCSISAVRMACYNRSQSPALTRCVVYCRRAYCAVFLNPGDGVLRAWVWNEWRQSCKVSRPTSKRTNCPLSSTRGTGCWPTALGRQPRATMHTFPATRPGVCVLAMVACV